MEEAGVWKEGEARMRPVHPLVGQRKAELRGVWSAVWMSASDDEREGCAWSG
jgi:hypothetical protein